MNSGTPTSAAQGGARRAGLGAFLRGILEFIDSNGLRAEVLARVPAETAGLFEAPPRPLSWVDARHIDAIERALFDLRGKDACLELGLCVARNLGGTVAQPVIRAAFFLFGEKPAAILAHLDRFFSLTTRGLAFHWQEEGPGRGSIEAVFAGPDVPEAALHVLQGTFQYVFELTRSPGSVGPPTVRRQDAKSTQVTYAVDLRG